MFSNQLPNPYSNNQEPQQRNHRLLLGCVPSQTSIKGSYRRSHQRQKLIHEVIDSGVDIINGAYVLILATCEGPENLWQKRSIPEMGRATMLVQVYGGLPSKTSQLVSYP